MTGLASLLLAAAFAQSAQNPSPMVEHTREHPRLKEETPPGRREKLEPGTLFLPEKWKAKSKVPLFIHFHGANWVPEVAAAKHGVAVISVQLGSGSGTYAKPFADKALFARWLAEAEKMARVRFDPVYLSAWSAGYGSVREILAVPENFARVHGVLLMDGLHTGYVGGKPGPLESQLETASLDVFVRFAREAIAGRKHLIVTHSEIFPGTFASTTETADYLLGELKLARKAVVRFGPMEMQQLSDVHRSGFRLMGYAGNSAPDHVDQLHALPELWKLLPH